MIFNSIQKFVKLCFFNNCNNVCKSLLLTKIHLCAERDGVANCDVMSCGEASKIIDLNSLE